MSNFVSLLITNKIQVKKFFLKRWERDKTLMSWLWCPLFYNGNCYCAQNEPFTKLVFRVLINYYTVANVVLFNLKFSNFCGVFLTLWNTAKVIVNKMEKIRHYSDITKNRMSLKNCRKNKKETYQEACQETCGNIKESAGLVGKYWPYFLKDNPNMHKSPQSIYQNVQ